MYFLFFYELFIGWCLTEKQKIFSIHVNNQPIPQIIEKCPKIHLRPKFMCTLSQDTFLFFSFFNLYFFPNKSKSAERPSQNLCS